MATSGSGCTSRVRVDTVTPLGRASARVIRARRRAAKAGSGSTGLGGRRRDSRGSVIALLPGFLGATEGTPGAHQQPLRCVDAAFQQVGHLRHRKVVEVAKRERRLVRWRQAGQRVAGTHGVEMGIPGIVRFLVVPVGGYRAEVPLLPGPPAPVVGQLVAGAGGPPRRGGGGGGATAASGA